MTLAVPATPRPVTPLGILALKLQRLRAQLGDLPAALAAGLAEALELAERLDPYLAVSTTPESDDLRRLAERTAREDWQQHASDKAAAPLEQEMLSGHVEGQLLKFLVAATRARRVLDIGMFTGYSALAMAEALPAEGVVIACEVDAYVAGFAQDSFDTSADGGKIDVRVAPAGETLAALAATGERFDLVFIDADKAGYLGYLQALLESELLAEGALVCVDNTLLQGQPYLSGEPTVYGAAVAEFNRVVAADPRLEQVMIPLRDGITLIRRVDRV